MVAISLIATVFAAFVLPSARADFPGFPSFCPSPPVDNIDLSKYTGRWYEIGTSALIKFTVERNCKCTEARYSLFNNNTEIQVQNVCTKKNGDVSTIFGTAKTIPSKGRSSDIGVSFIPGQAASSVNYIPVKVFGDYEQVLISTPCYIVIWILSRTPTISDERYKEIIKYARSVGLKPILIGFGKTNQDCPNRDLVYPPVPPTVLP